MLTNFFTAFVAIFLAELGDKTQLVSLNLASRFSPLQVLAGAMTGLTLVLALAVGAGGLIYTYIPLTVVTVASGIFFIFMGIWFYFQDDNSAEKTVKGKSGYYQAFLLVFLAEMGDKTQIATMLLSANFGTPLIVLAGALLAMLLNHTLAVFLGARYLARIPRRWIRLASSAIFVVIGAAILIFG